MWSSGQPCRGKSLGSLFLWLSRRLFYRADTPLCTVLIIVMRTYYRKSYSIVMAGTEE
ncbi:hypothetical protein DAQ1742_00368 [Dickeya aquatica]|uniref:Uncharacterized protein n=1 Tax=Dickeya aquatica TaxID=1401087 RepID=A0A375A5Z1_9GAMM|nr:hypothetical protein DAQ1742_00368 [Dickeya aquatica]